MTSLITTTAFLLAFNLVFELVSAAHAGFHVQYPWATRSANPTIRPELDQYNPFCGSIVHNPHRYSCRSRTFLSFSGHPGDLVTVLYSRNRVPSGRDDFPHLVLQDVPIQPSGQLCVNVTIPFPTKVNETGVMYFEARDPSTTNVEYICSDIQMYDDDALPEEHPAMCAAGNETLIPMPDEYL